MPRRSVGGLLSLANLTRAGLTQGATKAFSQASVFGGVFPLDLPMVWWRSSYSGSPWSAEGGGQVFPLSSGIAPSVGATVNGYAPASFDGTDDSLTTGTSFGLGAHLEDLFSPEKGWSAHFVAKFGALAADTNFYDEPALIAQDGASVVGITASASGVRAHQYGTGAPDVTPYVSVGTTDWHIVQARWNPVTGLLSIRVDGGPWSSVAMPDMFSAPERCLRVGVNYNFTAFLNAQILEIGLAQKPLTDAQFDALETYAIARYALGAAPVVGTLAVTLGACTSSAAGVAPSRGTLAATLGACTSSAAGAAPSRGTLATTLGACTSSAAGVAPVVGTLAATLGACTLSATGSALAPVSGALSATLGACVASAAGVAPVAGTLSRTLGACTSSAAGVAPIAGTLSRTLGACTSSASGVAPVVGTLAATLGACTSSAAGVAPSRGTLAATLGACTLSAAGVAPVVGTLAATLGACTLSATGGAAAPIVVARLVGKASRSARVSAVGMTGARWTGKASRSARVTVAAASDEAA